MNYLLDTCVLSDFFKKEPSTIAHFQNVSPNQLYISTVTIMEIEYGLQLHAEREKKIRPLWISLLKLMQVVPFCQECAASTSVLRAHLKSSGQLIGPYDLLIAGTSLTHKHILVTSNMKEFTRVPNLATENWRTLL